MRPSWVDGIGMMPTCASSDRVHAALFVLAFFVIPLLLVLRGHRCHRGRPPAGQLDAWLSAASLALDDCDLTRIADAIERTQLEPDSATDPRVRDQGR